MRVTTRLTRTPPAPKSQTMSRRSNQIEKITATTKSMEDNKGEVEILDDEVYQPITLNFSAKAVYGMDRLRKNRK